MLYPVRLKKNGVINLVYHNLHKVRGSSGYHYTSLIIAEGLIRLDADSILSSCIKPNKPTRINLACTRTLAYLYLRTDYVCAQARINPNLINLH